MKKNSVSACLVIYNEEKVIERCLKSIVGVVDEIIVVHDGPCRDKSLEISKKYGAKIFVKKHVGEAEYHRPFAFKKARGTWILHIDADEYLSKQLQKEIPQLVRGEAIDAYLFKWPIWNHTKNMYIKKGPYSKMLRMCLYRKSEMYMFGLTHFHPQTIGSFAERSDLLLNHKPKTPMNFKGEFQRKIFKWSRIAAKQVVNYESLPYFGPANMKLELLNSSVYKEYKLCYIYLFIMPVKRLLWFLKNGGLFSGIDSYKILVVDLSYIFFRYLLLIASRLKIIK